MTWRISCEQSSQVRWENDSLGVCVVAMATYLKNIFMEMQVEVWYWMLIIAVLLANIIQQLHQLTWRRSKPKW